MTPSRLILALAVLILAAIAIGRQVGQFSLAEDRPHAIRPAWGWLGCRYTEINPDIARGIGQTAGGVLVTEVLPGSPAEHGGMRVNDIIRTMDDEPIHTVEDLRSVIRGTTVGQLMTLNIIRQGQPQTLHVTLGSRPAPPPPKPPELPN